MKNELNILTVEEFREELRPLLDLIETLKNKVVSNPSSKNYYRNKDLKQKFGLSDNTIISYRDKNILPYTKFGDIYYYPVQEMDKILEQNSNYDLFKSKVA